MSAPRVYPASDLTSARTTATMLMIVVGLSLLSSLATAQQLPSTPASPVESPAKSAAPSFDVASIHPNKDDHTARSHIYYSLDDSHFRCINVTALQLIQWAWELPDSRILNAPSWVGSEHFDVEAKSDSAADQHFHALKIADARLEKDKMVQALLAERFRFASHIETRKLPVYLLVVAKGGPRLTAGQDAARHVDASGRNGSVAVNITNDSRATADLAESLYRYAGRVIIDKTGIAGNYTLALHFATDDSRTAIPSSDGTARLADPGPSLFSALKDQLGLELKPGSAPVDVLVIDHIDPPSGN